MQIVFLIKFINYSNMSALILLKVLILSKIQSKYNLRFDKFFYSQFPFLQNKKKEKHNKTCTTILALKIKIDHHFLSLYMWKNQCAWDQRAAVNVTSQISFVLENAKNLSLIFPDQLKQSTDIDSFSHKFIENKLNSNYRLSLNKVFTYFSWFKV